MKEFDYRVTQPAGLHARPAGMIVQGARNCGSIVTIEYNEKEVDATSLLSILSLCVKQYGVIKVKVSGDSEESDAANLKKLFIENL